MADLNALLTDWKDKRLAYKEVNRAAHEALLDGIVAEIEALKTPAQWAPAMLSDVQSDVASKRGPGRPPKGEAA